MRISPCFLARLRVRVVSRYSACGSLRGVWPPDWPPGVPRRGSRIGLPRTEVDHLALNDQETAADHLAAGLASLPAEQLGSEWVQEYKDAHERALERR